MQDASQNPQFDEVLREAYRRVRRQWGRWPRSRHIDEAKSAAHEAVLRAWQAYDPARGDFKKLADWYLRWAMNNLARQIDHRKETTAEFEVEACTATAASLPAEYVDSLTENQTAVLKGKYELGQTFSEIGKARGVTRQAAQRTHRRAIERLKREKVSV